jgi:hypothetical protein
MEASTTAASIASNGKVISFGCDSDCERELIGVSGLDCFFHGGESLKLYRESVKKIIEAKHTKAVLIGKIIGNFRRIFFRNVFVFKTFDFVEVNDHFGRKIGEDFFVSVCVPFDVNALDFHSGESLEFVGGLVKKKSTLVLRILNLFCEPAFLLENARAKNRLAGANE